MHHDLGNPAHRTGHHRCPAGHRFEIDDPEGLVNRRTDKNLRARIQRDDFSLRQHFLDPDHARTPLLRGFHRRLHFRRNLRRIRRTGAEHDLETRVQMPQRFDQMNNPLLPRDAPDKQNIRARRIDPMTLQYFVVPPLRVFLEVDAVVNDVHTRRIDAKQPQQVGLGRFAHRNHRISHFDRGLFHPPGKIVPATELLPLPRAQRLERVGGQHQR